MKQKELSVWLKGLLVFTAAVVLAVSAAVPALGGAAVAAKPALAALLWPLAAFFWASTLPVFAALALGWRIAADIGRDRSFTQDNARRLTGISRLALGDTLWYALGGAVLLATGRLTLGLLGCGLLVLFVGIVVAVAAAALSHLTEKAAALDDENSLTI